MKRKEFTAGLSLLALASALCLAGLRTIERRLSEREREP